ncbi:MAG: prepilin-type N-terminal cleavage/methylation domain-containing protein [Candidatus Moraniibacteriota bacterium]
MKINFIKKSNPPYFCVRRGFTLLEVVVAIAIFSIISLASTGAFVSIFKSYKNAKNLNENLKNGQYAMNLMNKTFRTSTVVVSVFSNSIEVYDYSQSKCFKYEFFGGKLLRSESNRVIGASEAACESFPAGEAMTSGEVFGAFKVEKSEGGDYTDSDGNNIGPKSVKVGRVTTAMKISNGEGVYKREAYLQSTVSLRDYVISNIGIDQGTSL